MADSQPARKRKAFVYHDACMNCADFWRGHSLNYSLCTDEMILVCSSHFRSTKQMFISAGGPYHDIWIDNADRTIRKCGPYHVYEDGTTCMKTVPLSISSLPQWDLIEVFFGNIRFFFFLLLTDGDSTERVMKIFNYMFRLLVTWHSFFFFFA